MNPVPSQGTGSLNQAWQPWPWQVRLPTQQELDSWSQARLITAPNGERGVLQFLEQAPPSDYKWDPPAFQSSNCIEA